MDTSDYRDFFKARNSVNQDGMIMNKYSPMANAVLKTIGASPNKDIESTMETVLNPAHTLLNALGVSGDQIPGWGGTNYSPLAYGVMQSAGGYEGRKDRLPLELVIDTLIGGVVGKAHKNAYNVLRETENALDAIRVNRLPMEAYKAKNAKEVAEYAATRNMDNESLFGRLGKSKELMTEIQADRMARLREIMDQKTPDAHFAEKFIWGME